jgi:Inhibitor of growth proteins N-terminal histone-binding
MRVTLLHRGLVMVELQGRISDEIDSFMVSAGDNAAQERAQQLFKITHLMTSSLSCADEKVSVASAAADISEKHSCRLDHDFGKLNSSEISELIRYGPADHPAFVHGSTMGMSRSESRRLALAQSKKNDEELLEWKKEQVGRRGQLVAEESAAAAAAAAARNRGVGGQKKRSALGVMTGVKDGNGIQGKGTPSRGETPLGALHEIKKSHHKKKPTRGEEDSIAQKRKHPNQYALFGGVLTLDILVDSPVRMARMRTTTIASARRRMKVSAATNVPTAIATAEVTAKWSPAIAKTVPGNGSPATVVLANPGSTSSARNWLRPPKENGTVATARRSWSESGGGDRIRSSGWSRGKRRDRSFALLYPVGWELWVLVHYSFTLFPSGYPLLCKLVSRSKYAVAQVPFQSSATS